MQSVLLTGSDELIGTHVLAALADREDIGRIIVLKKQPAAETTSAGQSPRVEIEFLKGDVRQPNFGLPEQEWKGLGQRIDAVFDCAVSQCLACASAHRNRVAAASNWIEFLKQHEHLRLNYLSSAFVAGQRRGLFTEFDLDLGQSFHNEWERGNFEAERLLRASPINQRVTIFRPSLIVGEEQTGRIAAFTGFYKVLHLLCQRKLKVLAGGASTRLDVVPVDYVTAAVIALSAEQGSAGKNYHLVAGWQKSITLQALVRLVTNHAGSGATRARFVPPFMNWLARGTTTLTCGRAAGSKLTAAYCEYLRRPAAVFDNYLASSSLEKEGLSCPPLESYLDRVIQFAELHNWTPGHVSAPSAEH